MSLRYVCHKGYLKNLGNTCPFCGSENIEGSGERDTDADFHTNSIECKDCGKDWQDFYKIVGILVHEKDFELIKKEDIA